MNGTDFSSRVGCCQCLASYDAKRVMDDWYLSLCLCPQVIQTISAVDKDNPSQGHTFHYRLEMLNNPNFTIKNNLGMFIYTFFFYPMYHYFIVLATSNVMDTSWDWEIIKIFGKKFTKYKRKLETLLTMPLIVYLWNSDVVVSCFGALGLIL